MSDEKTEEPTDKKLEDAAEKGQHIKSQDLSSATLLLGTTICLGAAAATAADRLMQMLTLVLGPQGIVAADEFLPVEVGYRVAFEWLVIAGPVTAVAAVVGAVTALAQSGINLTFEPLGPNFDKLNPAEGIKNVFSVKSIIEFFKMVVKALALGAVCYSLIHDLVPLLAGSAYQTPLGIATIAWTAMLKLLYGALVVFCLIVPVDYGIARWQFMEQQKMTKDEVKRERKESEGDPQLKSKRKQIAKEMVMNAPKATVPGATAVVTNPTHFAVALRYDPQTCPVPVVLCKGADAEAAEIRALAAQHNVPVIGNPPLARALFKVPCDEVIPEELFAATAAVLRWVALVDRLAPALAAPAQDGSGAASKR
jgi:type III secretion protein U